MVYIVLGSGFEEIEAIAPGDILRRGGVPVCYVGIGGKEISGGHEIPVLAAKSVSVLREAGAGDTIVIPGGLGGVESIENSAETMEILAEARDRGVRFGAICAGPRILAGLNMLEGRRITCYPGCESWMTGAEVFTDESVVVDGDLITGRAPGSAIDFGLALLAAAKGEAAAQEIRSDMHYAG